MSTSVLAVLSVILAAATSCGAYSITGRVMLGDSAAPSPKPPASAYAAFRVQLTDQNGAVLRSHLLDASGVFDFAIDAGAEANSRFVVRLQVANPRAFGGRYTAELTSDSESTFTVGPDREAYAVTTLLANLKKVTSASPSSSSLHGAPASSSSSSSGTVFSALVTGSILVGLVVFREAIVSLVEIMGSSVRKPRRQVLVAQR